MNSARIEQRTSKQVISKRAIFLILACILLLYVLLFSAYSAFTLLGTVNYFPTSKELVVQYPLEQIRGELIIKGNALRLAKFPLGIAFAPANETLLLLWPHGYSWDKTDLLTEVRDGNGRS
jgi:hypothetical protein